MNKYIARTRSIRYNKPYSNITSIKQYRYSQASLVPKLLRLMAKA